MGEVNERDGFVIRDYDGNEVHFVPCQYNGNQRERVERGLLMKTRNDLIVADTRWDHPEAGEMSTSDGLGA